MTMKSLAGVLLWTILVCGACSLRQRTHLNREKAFLDSGLFEREVQVLGMQLHSHFPPGLCSGFSNLAHCFKLKLMNNVSEILGSEEFWLAKNLVIEKLRPDELDSRDILKNRVLRMRLENYIALGIESNKLIIEGTMGIFRSHSLRWILYPGINLRLLRNLKYGGKMDMALEIGDNNLTAEEGAGSPRKSIKRKKLGLIAFMYKIRIMMTLLAALVLITLKSLAVGIIILFLSGFNTFQSFGGELHWPSFNGQHHSFNSHTGPEMAEASAPAKGDEVHIHIHNGEGASGDIPAIAIEPSTVGPNSKPYHGWSYSVKRSNVINSFRRSSVETSTRRATRRRLQKDGQVISF